MKKKIAKFIKSKGGKWTIIGTTIFLVVGIAAFVLGYGLTAGWLWVAQWFVSKWAIMVYVFIALYIIVVIRLIYLSKSYIDDDGKDK